MASIVSVETTNNFSSWKRSRESEFSRAVTSMGKAIMNNAKMTVPRKSGKLAKSATVKTSGTSATVTFGSSSVRYAAVQEKGSRNGIVFRNYTTPGTGPHYLENAGDAVAKKGLKAYL